MKQIVMIAGGMAVAVGLTIAVWGQGGQGTIAATPTGRGAASSGPASRAAATAAANGQADEGKTVLAQKIPEIDMTAATLASLINDMSMWVNATIEVDWASLKAAGLDEERPLTFRMNDATLEEVLKVICAKETEGKAGVEVKYKYEGGAVKIFAVKTAAVAK